MSDIKSMHEQATKRFKPHFLIFKAAILSLMIVGCSQSPDRAIETVLNNCAKSTEKVNSSSMSAARAADYLASQMQRMDTRECPPEFRMAFQEHINAWRQAAGAFAQDTPLNSFLDGFAAGYLKDPSLYGASQKNAAIAVNNINQTYNQLVSIAAAHGARVPESVVR